MRKITEHITRFFQQNRTQPKKQTDNLLGRVISSPTISKIPYQGKKHFTLKPNPENLVKKLQAPPRPAASVPEIDNKRLKLIQALKERYKISQEISNLEKQEKSFDSELPSDHLLSDQWALQKHDSQTNGEYIEALNEKLEKLSSEIKALREKSKPLRPTTPAPLPVENNAPQRAATPPKRPEGGPPIPVSEPLDFADDATFIKQAQEPKNKKT